MPELTELDLDTAIRLAHEVVAERGADFVYAPDGEGVCAYVPVTDPRFPSLKKRDAPAEGARVTGCLVGEILRKADLLTDKVARSGDQIGTLIRNGAVPATQEAQVFLSWIQMGQDEGDPWGATLRTAEQETA